MRPVFAHSSRWWRGITPHRWQREALPEVVAQLGRGRSPVVSAVMGSGKTRLVSELCANVQLAQDQVVLVSTPQTRLVRQIAAELEGRIGADAVGQWFGEVKHLPVNLRVLVTCNPSLPACAEVLEQAGVRPALWVADECHGTNAPTVLDVGRSLGCARVGFTATPYRADAAELLELYDSLAYAYGPHDALRDGVVVPWEVWTRETLPSHARPKSPDPDELALAMVRRAVSAKLGAGICDASSIEDAQDFASALRALGVKASAIHSGQDAAQQDRLLADLQGGALDCLVQVALLVEGVNLPWVRWLLLRRDVQSRVRHAQYVGRALRRHAGKTRAVLLDPRGITSRLALSYEAALWLCDDDGGEQGEQDQEARVRTKAHAALLELRRAPLKLAHVPDEAARASYLIRTRNLASWVAQAAQSWLDAGLASEAREITERAAVGLVPASARSLLLEE